MAKITYNERSWAIDIIAETTVYSSSRNQIIKRAGGESTINTGGKRLFPDVLLYGENSDILMGWELKMPDTPISDQDFIDNATIKAEILRLNSFLLWNGQSAVLYKLNNDTYIPFKSWDTSHCGTITDRLTVEKNRSLWTLSLHEILKDLNTFLESGDIKKKPLIESFKDSSIMEFILKSSSINAGALKSAARADAIFEAEANVWWRISQNEYPNHDQWEILSEIILVNWINKFLFAHILTAYRNEAKVIYDIDYSVTPSQAANTFQDISSTCDFWNIFQPQLGEKYILSDSWNEVIQLSQLLKDIELASIGQDLLQSLLENVIYSSKRKVAGQYTTPMFLARLLVLLTLNNKTETIHDPCCGTGTIARAAYDIKKEAGINPRDSLASVFASDKVAFPLQMATLAISEPVNIGEIVQIFKKDCSEIVLGEDIEFSDPFNGSIINRTYNEINNIASNLPFIQQEDINELNPEIKTKINSFLTEHLSRQDKLQGKSDLYAYLPFAFWDIIAEDGRLGIIISNSWLGTEWGATFKKLLARFYKIEYILTASNGRWFQNADVITNIMILSKRSEPVEELEDNEHTKFITISHNFYIDSDYSNVQRIYENIITNTVDTSLKIEDYLTKDILDIPLNWNALFSDISWLEQIQEKIIFCNSLFEINRGARRGWDPMFYPSENHGIEYDFICPVLKTSRDINSLVTTADSEAFCCTMSINDLRIGGYTGAINWINMFEHQFNGTGKPLPEVLAISNGYWYTMHNSEMADLITGMNPDKRIFISKLNEKSFVNQRLIRFTSLNANNDIELSHALLNSLLGIFFIESLGFGRGLGALDLSSTRMKKYLKMLDPSLLNEEQIQNIKEKFNLFKTRNIKDITEELEDPIRKDFDFTILKAYEIEHLYDSIKNSFLFLYQMRNSVRER
ncbi:N-6 DNA methylase [Sulfurospirillum sp. 'SP']|nr:N-6 DNA methylase [Sulfurospirillum sp. 'SP']WNY99953.1 N-6 DNA methylase [Sulfurospirillum sp. 'SP']